MDATTKSLTHTNFRLWLQAELVERCKKNPSYSLRAFASFLKIDPSSLSQIISGKRPLSAKTVNHICEKLSISPLQTQDFLMGLKKKSKEAASPNEDKDYLLIAEDTFAVISDWYHVAILELTFTETFRNNPKWIARALSISVSEVKIAIERLLRLGLLTENDGKLSKTDKTLTNFAGITTSATKEFQRQLLQEALRAIDNCEAGEKDITSMTMAIDEKKLPQARALIKEFRRNLCAYLEQGEQTRVYNLGIQLFPLSKKE